MIQNPNLPKQHKSCHLQIDPAFSNQRFATASRTDWLPFLQCRQCYQSTEHTCPPTYPKHVRIGSCTKKLEQIFDFSFFWKDTVYVFLKDFWYLILLGTPPSPILSRGRKFSTKFGTLLGFLLLTLCRQRGSIIRGNYNLTLGHFTRYDAIPY